MVGRQSVCSVLELVQYAAKLVPQRNKNVKKYPIIQARIMKIMNQLAMLNTGAARLTKTLLYRKRKLNLMEARAGIWMSSPGQPAFTYQQTRVSEVRR